MPETAQSLAAEGERDFYQAMHFNQNPYPRGTREADDWAQGWQDAWDEYRKRQAVNQ